MQVHVTSPLSFNFLSTQRISISLVLLLLASFGISLTFNRWLYLVTFNGLWVVVPLWILYEGYQAIGSAMSQSEMVDLVNYLNKKA